VTDGPTLSRLPNALRGALPVALGIAAGAAPLQNHWHLPGAVTFVAAVLAGSGLRWILRGREEARAAGVQDGRRATLAGGGLILAAVALEAGLLLLLRPRLG
jgi:hypothetical protein